MLPASSIRVDEFLHVRCVRVVRVVVAVGGGDVIAEDQATASHRGNYDVYAEASRLVFRDDISASDGYHHPDHPGTHHTKLVDEPIDDAGSIGLFSPHNYARQVAASGAAVWSYSGWLDGGYPHAAIKRHLALPRGPGNRLVLGPGNHGGGWNISDPSRRRATEYDHEGELLRFFDHHLRGCRPASRIARR